jgi:hypothetical protein
MDVFYFYFLFFIFLFFIFIFYFFIFIFIFYFLFYDWYNHMFRIAFTCIFLITELSRGATARDTVWNATAQTDMKTLP